MTDTVCLNKDETSGDSSSCAVSLEFCGVDTLTTTAAAYDYVGILGLGISDTNENFVKLWAEGVGAESVAIFNMDFDENDSSIQFGVDDTSSYTMLGSSTNSSVVGDWSLSTGALYYNGKNYTDYTGVALLSTAYPSIGVPSDLWDSIADDLKDLGFLCNERDIDSNKMCITATSCSEAAAYMTSMEFTFNGTLINSDGSSSDGFTLDIDTSFYLWQNPDSGYCESLITVNSDDSTTPFILGDPFFRQFTVMFDYSTTNVTIISRTNESPITPAKDFPTASDSETADVSMTVDAKY